MLGFAPRIFAAFTALAVLLASVNCVCAKALSGFTGASVIGECGAHSCSDGQGEADEDHHCSDAEHNQKDSRSNHSNPCDRSCNHCGQTVIDDNVVAKDLSPLASATPFAAALTTLQPSFATVLNARSVTGDVQPTTLSPTLLNLHCALVL